MQTLRRFKNTKERNKPVRSTAQMPHWTPQSDNEPETWKAETSQRCPLCLSWMNFVWFCLSKNHVAVCCGLILQISTEQPRPSVGSTVLGVYLGAGRWKVVKVAICWSPLTAIPPKNLESLEFLHWKKVVLNKHTNVVRSLCFPKK